MSQLENTQTVVLQQTDGKKIYLDLNVSTDTTAIWSFWLAMIVALILGASATLIAVWYGRKSFEITKMSFEALIKEIQATSENNRVYSLDLIQSQLDHKNAEFKFIQENKWLNEALDTYSIILEVTTDVIGHISVLYKYIEKDKENNTYIDFKSSQFYLDEFKKLDKTVQESSEKIMKMKLLLQISYTNFSNSILFLNNLNLNLAVLINSLFNNQITEAEINNTREYFIKGRDVLTEDLKKFYNRF